MATVKYIHIRTTKSTNYYVRNKFPISIDISRFLVLHYIFTVIPLFITDLLLSNVSRACLFHYRRVILRTSEIRLSYQITLPNESHHHPDYICELAEVKYSS